MGPAPAWGRVGLVPLVCRQEALTWSQVCSAVISMMAPVEGMYMLLNFVWIKCDFKNLQETQQRKGMGDPEKKLLAAYWSSSGCWGPFGESEPAGGRSLSFT